jgi:hypothetical protein
MIQMQAGEKKEKKRRSKRAPGEEKPAGIIQEFQAPGEKGKGKREKGKGKREKEKGKRMFRGTGF